MRVVINEANFRKKCAPAVGRALIKYLSPKINRAVKSSNTTLLETFLNHAITQEILAGPMSTNFSNTLGGHGNLFSFLGFEAGSEPVAKVAEFLASCIEVEGVRHVRGTFKVNVSVRMPKKEEIEELSELPWANRSWVYAMETGIAGLGSYLYSTKGFETSRSDKGIQASKTVRSGRFIATEYMSTILNAIPRHLVSSLKAV